MKAVRVTASILYYITSAAAFLFFATAIYSFVVLSLSLYTHVAGLPITTRPDNSFIIFYPFTKTPFLAGDYTSYYLATSTGVVILYSLFLWLLSEVFKTFKQLKLFTPRSVCRLERFYVFNLGVPVLSLMILFFIGQEIRDTLIIVFLHIMIGVFAFFMAAIFKQGLLLQEEQDLTL
jgi:hypothetical protein